MTKQQIQSKFIPLIEKKPIKALGIISKIALGLTFVCLIIGFAFMSKTNIPAFTLFLCQLKYGGISQTHNFGIGWICFIMIMIFILTALPHYLIHLLTFKRIIITPIMLVLSILAFGMILGCLFASISSNPELSSSYGIYKFSFDSSSFTNKIKPTALGIVTLICVVATLIVSCIPARKKVSK